MSDINTDYDLEPDCEDCNTEDECFDASCLFRMFIGPCGAYDTNTGEVDMSRMCVPPTATAHTPSMVNPFIETTRRNKCGITRVPGMQDCNVAVSFDTCHEEPTMKYLWARCPITLMLIPRIDLFDITAPQATQPLVIMRGRFIGSDYNMENEFAGIQQSSRTFSSSGGCRGIQQWLDSLPDASPIKTNPAKLIADRRNPEKAMTQKAA